MYSGTTDMKRFSNEIDLFRMTTPSSAEKLRLPE
jgi:hypothetical protein